MIVFRCGTVSRPGRTVCVIHSRRDEVMSVKAVPSPGALRQHQRTPPQNDTGWRTAGYAPVAILLELGIM